MGQFYKELRESILETFEVSDLEIVVGDLGKNLEWIVQLDDNSNRVVFHLLRVARREGWLEELLKALAAARPDNESFKTSIARALESLAAPTAPESEGDLDEEHQFRSATTPMTAAQPRREAILKRPDGSWADFFFSFNGRISREQFLVWYLVLSVALVILVVAIAIPFAFAVGVTFEAAFRRRELEVLYHIASIPFWWPKSALYLKRLHDFGQGWAIFWGTMIVSLAYFPLFFAGYEDAAKMGVAGLAVMLLIGCMKGTLGPNQFGPDPLERG
ncbi:MAG: DUF805 domain-containing protein [Tardiphaga sp.]|jgi:uncharacterized membrane protein YhaH (DUF805 family)